MDHFLDKISLEGTRFEKLNSEIDFLGKDGKSLHLVVLAGVNGSGKTNLLNLLHKPFFEKKKVWPTLVNTRILYVPKKEFKNYVDNLIYVRGLTVFDAIDDINNKIFKLLPDLKLKMAGFSFANEFTVDFSNELGIQFYEGLASGEITILNSIFSTLKIKFVYFLAEI